jgi:hypothetical protein
MPVDKTRFRATRRKTASPNVLLFRAGRRLCFLTTGTFSGVSAAARDLFVVARVIVMAAKIHRSESDAA